MFRLIFWVVVAIGAWQAYTHFDGKRKMVQGVDSAPALLLSEPRSRAVDVGASTSKFKCDGRTHCSQMTSCEEATYFLRNCPGTKMDGDGDGIPCERQLCQ